MSMPPEPTSADAEPAGHPSRFQPPSRATTASRLRAAGLALASLLLSLAAAPGLLRAQPDEPSAEVLLGDAEARVFAAAGVTVTATLHDASGPRAEARAQADEDGVARLQLRAADGAAVALNTGMTLTWSAGGPARQEVLPPLELRAEAAERRVSGRAPGADAVRLRFHDAQGSAPLTATAIVGAGGGFGQPYPSSFEDVPGAFVIAERQDGVLRTRSRWDLPTAFVRLGETRVEGTYPLRSQAAVTLGGALAAGPSRAAEGPPPSRYALELQDGAGAPRPLEPGDRLGLLLDGHVALEGRAPDIRARVDTTADRVLGRSDAGTALRILARDAEGAEVYRDIIAKPEGAFTVDLSDRIDLRPDTRVEIRTHGPLSFGARALAEQVTVTLGTALLDGRAAPRDAVHARLLDVEGRERGSGGDVSALRDGAFHIALRDGDGRPAFAETGDRVVLQWESTSEGINLRIPELGASVEPDTGRVRGVALPGMPLVVRLRSGTQREERRVTAAADGTWVAAFTLAIGPGASGAVAMTLDDRVTLLRPFALPDAAVNAEEGRVEGLGAVGQEIELRLSRGGVEIARARTAVTESLAGCRPCLWGAQLRDAAGWPLPARPGDVLRLTVDGQPFDSELPALALEGNPVADLVLAEAPPGQAIALRVGREGEGEGPSIPLTAGSDGRVRERLAERGLEVGDRLTATLSVGPFTYRATHRVGALLATRDEAAVQGWGLPGGAAEARLTDDRGTELATASGLADGDGRVHLTLRDAEGGPRPLLPGDRLELGSGGVLWRLTLPAIEVPLPTPETMAQDPLLAADVVRAQAPAEGRLELLAVQPADDRGATALRDAVWQDGGWHASFADRLDVSAGTALEARWTSPEGHRVLRRLRLPLLRAQVAGSRASGFAAPEAELRVEVWRGVTRIAQSFVGAGQDGAFALSLEDMEAGSGLDASDRVILSWEAGRLPPRTGRVELRLADLGLVLAEDASRAEGRAPAGSAVFLGLSGGGLPGGLPPRPARAGADGRWALDLLPAPERPAGTRATIGHLDAAGHQSQRVDLLPRVELVLGESGLRGLAPPLSSFTATLRAEGAPIGAGGARADSSGDFALGLLPLGPRAVVLASGQELRLAGDRLSVGLLVPPLSATIDRDGKVLHGIAPALEPVELRLEAEGLPPAVTRLVAGLSGTWALDEASFPGAITIARLRRAEARVRTAEGHGVRVYAYPPGVPSPTPGPSATSRASVTPTPGPGDPSPTPTTPPSPPATPATDGEIYLPWAYRSDG